MIFRSLITATLIGAAAIFSTVLTEFSEASSATVPGTRVPATPTPAPEKQDEVAAFLLRFAKPEHMYLLQGAMWTLTHDYKEKDNPEKVLDVLIQYQEAAEQWVGGNKTPLNELGGIKAYKDKMAAWLEWEDESVRAFGAVMLGIAGDATYAPSLAKKLGEKCEDEYGCYDRSRFALALGMMNAVEFKPALLKMLESQHDSDRAGGIWGLISMKATDTAEKIAALQADKDESVREAAVEALKGFGREDLIRKK